MQTTTNNPINREVEVRFLEIDASDLKRRLSELGAEDLGEDMYEEIIAYKDASWLEYKRKFIRLRKTKKGTSLTYKHQEKDTIDGTEEIEFEVSDFAQAELFLKRIGFDFFMRRQQKKRHAFKLNGVSIDIDTWPRIPTYVELEGDSEQIIKDAAKNLGLDWSKAVFENPRIVMEKYYNLPVATFHWFTFDKVE
jgi:adenylate cyclase class 2